MVKLAFNMTTSYGDAFEYAMNEERKWFVREYGYNGYGMGWSKWNETESQEVEFCRETTEMHNGRIRTRRIAMIDGGFGSKGVCFLSEDGKRVKQPRYRLPK